MTNIDYYKVKEEMVVFLRNSDVMTTTLRGVTTLTDSALGTLLAASSVLIARSNVRNIRDVKVGAVELVYDTDYQVDYFYSDSGTRKCKLTFTVAQTGVATTSYDYGSDKIYPDYPQTTLNIDDFPRISVDLLGVETVPGAIGNVNKSKINYTLTVYATSKTNILDYLTSIRSKIMNAQLTFKYLGAWVTPGDTSPLIVYEQGKQKVFQQSIDVQAPYKLEIN